jgi:hypothetical protein
MFGGQVGIDFSYLIGGAFRAGVFKFMNKGSDNTILNPRHNEAIR